MAHIIAWANSSKQHHPVDRLQRLHGCPWAPYTLDPPHIEYALPPRVLRPSSHLPLPQGATMAHSIAWANSSQHHHLVDRL